MKRWTTLLIVICMLGITIPAMGAMSISKMRQNTRFLTDRMAYDQICWPFAFSPLSLRRASHHCSIVSGTATPAASSIALL